MKFYGVASKAPRHFFVTKIEKKFRKEGISELSDHHSENTNNFSKWGASAAPLGLNRVNPNLHGL